MPSRRMPVIAREILLNALIQGGEDTETIQAKLKHLEMLRGQSKAASSELDLLLLQEVGKMRAGLGKAKECQEKLKKIVDKLTSPPLNPAIFLGLVPVGATRAAAVSHGNALRVVLIGDEVNPDMLAVGDEVLLTEGRNVLLARSSCPPLRCGETALFSRYTEDGRVVLTWRDEEVVVNSSGRLAGETLRQGDVVRWDRAAWLAHERLERPTGEHYFLEESPTETFDDVGGLDPVVAEVEEMLQLHVANRDLVRKYHLRRKGSLLFVGPPGTGKTLLAKAVANRLKTLSRAGRSRFMNIKPGGLGSIWYSQTEANFREIFRVARSASEADPDAPVVMFFDEVDAIGAARGTSMNRVDDRVQQAFMVELDGLESRGNILVIAATNRMDALDPALMRPGRLRDKVIEIPRPSMPAARGIFRKYLTSGVPYAANGHDPAAMREILIDSAVSRIYAPNGAGDLVSLRFRDGRERRIAARDLMSGASIARIAWEAIERACVREARTGESGVRLSDVMTAIDEELAESARALTPANCHKYLTDLPHDADVARVEPVVKRAARTHRYLKVA